jgi:hypothetical protein
MVQTYTDTEFKVENEVATEITLKLTAEEDIALRCEMNPCQWISNALHNRARIAIDTITTDYVRDALENGWTIPQSKIEILNLAFDKIQGSKNDQST